jgi:hypothetical protein
MQTAQHLLVLGPVSESASTWVTLAKRVALAWELGPDGAQSSEFRRLGKWGICLSIHSHRSTSVGYTGAGDCHVVPLCNKEAAGRYGVND